jgi:signal transduction histidine kinase
MHNKKTIAQRVGERLFAALLAGWFFVLLLAAIGLIAYYRTDRDYTQVMRQAEELQSCAFTLNAAIVSEILNTRAYIISGEEAALTRRRLNHQTIEREMAALDQMLIRFPTLSAPSLAVLTSLHQEYDQTGQQLIELRQAGRHADALTLFDARSDPLVASVQTASQDLQREIQQGINASSREYSRRTEQAIFLVALLLIASMAASGIFILRYLNPLLQQLDLFENALVNAANTRIYQPFSPPVDETGAVPPLFTAYNHMAENLRQSSAAVLRYLSRLSHESNSLLASIQGYGYMVADPDLRPEGACLEEYGQIIVQQTQRVNRLVDDFTLAARIDGQQFQPAMTPVCLAPLLDALIDDLRDESGRTIHYLRPPASPVVMADSLSLESALRKLVENALKFSPPDQPVSVLLKPLPTCRSVEIQVSDQGAGIAAEDLPRLFHPFTRLDTEATRRIPGNGMGLYLANCIVRAQRGSITVKSQPGQGATFIVRLPVEEA